MIINGRNDDKHDHDWTESKGTPLVLEHTNQPKKEGLQGMMVMHVASCSIVMYVAETIQIDQQYCSCRDHHQFEIETQCSGTAVEVMLPSQDVRCARCAVGRLEHYFDRFRILPTTAGDDG